MTHTMTTRGLIIGLALGLGLAATANGSVVINFDDRPGMPPPFFEGMPIPPQYLIHNEYLSLGVSFDSGGGGLALGAASNCPSLPNCVSPTGPGPTLDYSYSAAASFWSGGAPALVDMVS